MPGLILFEKTYVHYEQELMMYTIEKRPSGFLLTFGGFMMVEEMQKWYDESLQALKTAPSIFGVIIDLRSLKPLPPEVQALMVKGQQAYKMRGMQRSCVILANELTKFQFMRLAKDSGIYTYERYIDAEATSNWVDIAVAWVRDNKDPDK